MRLVYFLLLLVFLAAVGIFAVQNQEATSIQFLNQVISSPLSLILIGGYVLGMLSGWTVVGFMKWSWQHVTERQSQ